MGVRTASTMTTSRPVNVMPTSLRPTLTGESANTQHPLPERLGIVGSGTIARGLATVAGRHGPGVQWARSEVSARRARGFLDIEAVEVTCERSRLAEVSFLVEAIVEEQAAQAAL